MAPLVETLGPEDWDEFRALAHRAVDDMIEHTRTLRERPIWRRMLDAFADEVVRLGRLLARS